MADAEMKEIPISALPWVIDEFNKMKSDTEIGQKFNVSKSVVRNFRLRHGIKRDGSEALEIGPQINMEGTRWRRGPLWESAIAEIYQGRRYG